MLKYYSNLFNELNSAIFEPLNDKCLCYTSSIKDVMKTFKDGENLVGVIELPGYKKEDIDIKVEDKYITIEATRELYGEKETYKNKFVSNGKWDLTNVTCSLENGLLKLIFVPKEDQKALKISIN